MTNELRKLIFNNSKMLTDFYKKFIDIKKETIDSINSIYDIKTDIEKEDVEEVLENLIGNTNEFCLNSKNGKEITIAAGILLNIYYSEGFFEILGFFPIEKIAPVTDSDRIYIKLEELFILHLLRNVYSENSFDTNYISFIDDYIGNNCNLVSNYDKTYPLDSILYSMKEYNPHYDFSYLYSLIHEIIKCTENDYFIWGKPFERIPEIIKPYLSIIDLDLLTISVGAKKFTTFVPPNPKNFNFKDISTFRAEVPMVFGYTHFGLPFITDKIKEHTKTNIVRNSLWISRYVNLKISFELIFSQYLVSAGQSLQIDNQMKILAAQKEALEIAKQEKEDIISDFSHRYKNMRATNLYDISQAFLSSDDEGLRKYGKQIFNEYLIKSDLSHEVEMLILYFKDNIDELKALINDKKSGRQNRPIGIDGSIKNATVRCLNKMMYDLKNQEMSCFTPYKEEQDALINKYTDEITLTETDCEQVLSWVEKNLSTTVKIQIADRWKLVKYNEGSYTDLIVTDILNEIIYNAFKYADKEKPISLSFDYDNNTNVFTIMESNYFKENNVHGTMQGLSSIERLLKKLNGDKSIFSNLSEVNNKFQVAIVLSGDVFFNEINGGE